MQITTPAPISLEDLKKYYEDKDTSYLIDYKQSSLKEQKLLTYLSNLGLECDIQIDEINDEYFTLLKTYFHSPSLVKIPFLELCAIDVLLEYKGIIHGDRYRQFITENLEIVSRWVNILDSLIVYNHHIFKDEQSQAAIKDIPHDDTDSIEGINWVSVLKHTEFYDFYLNLNTDNLKFYTKYFNDYMFKGSNLYSFWTNKNNPIFLLTWGEKNGDVTNEKIQQVIEQSQEELKNVTSN